MQFTYRHLLAGYKFNCLNFELSPTVSLNGFLEATEWQLWQHSPLAGNVSEISHVLSLKSSGLLQHFYIFWLKEPGFLDRHAFWFPRVMTRDVFDSAGLFAF